VIIHRVAFISYAPQAQQSGIYGRLFRIGQWIFRIQARGKRKANQTQDQHQRFWHPYHDFIPFIIIVIRITQCSCRSDSCTVSPLCYWKATTLLSPSMHNLSADKDLRGYCHCRHFQRWHNVLLPFLDYRRALSRDITRFYKNLLPDIYVFRQAVTAVGTRC